MEKAINFTINLCPQYPNASFFVPSLYDPEIFRDPSQLAEISCQAQRLVALPLYDYVTYSKKIYAVAFAFGTVSCVLSLLSYSLKEFQALAFYYYRAINAFDLFYMISYLLYSLPLNTIPSVHACLACNVITDFLLFITRICARAAHWLVLWVSFDRTLACLFPMRYHCFDKKRVARFVIICIATMSLISDMPNTLNSALVKYYRINVISLGLADNVLEKILRALEGVLMLIFMICVTVGMIKMSKRKRKFMKNASSDKSNKKALDQIRHNYYLCVLQLCEGVPFILTDVLTYLRYLTNFLAYEYNGFIGLTTSPVVPHGTYEQNLSHQKIILIQQFIDAFCVGISDMYSHCFHFFTYFAFSPKFRRVVLAHLCKRTSRETVLG